MSSTITVYVMPHDDEDVRWIINTEHDMEENYDEMLDDVYGPVSIAGCDYDTSRVLKEVDPIAYRVGFSDYTGSDDWRELEMPVDLWLSDDDEARWAWIESKVED